MHNNIAILIIFFNKLSQTIECVESFLPSGQHIYILNNASEEGSWKLLQNKFGQNSQVSLYHSEINLGPARGRNLLLEKCLEEWIFLADNDVCIQPVQEWKLLFDEKLAEQKDALIFNPAIFNVHENSYLTAHHFALKKNVVYMEEATTDITNCFSCCGVIMNRKVFDVYGNFDPALFAFEDYEFSIRALCSAAGELKVYPLPAIELLHDHQVQQKKADKRAVIERYNKDRIASSMQRLREKHQVKFDHEWQWWTRKQVADMTEKSVLKKVKHGICRILKLK